jgi:hypothetical protein
MPRSRRTCTHASIAATAATPAAAALPHLWCLAAAALAEEVRAEGALMVVDGVKAEPGGTGRGGVASSSSCLIFRQWGLGGCWGCVGS